MRSHSSHEIRNIYVGAAVALSLLLCIIFVGAQSLKKRATAFELVQHTFQVITKLQDLQSKINQIGREQRGYILTSQERYKEVFQKLTPEIQGEVEGVRELTIDNEVQQNNFQTLIPKVTDLISFYSLNISLVDTRMAQVAIKNVKEGKGETLTLEIVSLVTRMINHEKKLLQDRLDAHQKARDRANLITILGASLTFLIVLLATLLVIYELKRRLLIQENLNKTTLLQKTILDSAAFAIVSCDSEGKIVLFNLAAEKLLGYTAEEVIGKTPTLFHVPKEIEEKASELSKEWGETISSDFETLVFLPKRGITNAAQWTYLRKDGRPIPVALRVSAQKDEQGNITGYVGLAYDKSTELEYEHQIIKAKELAESGNQAKSEFLANMSHEIRTPMNAILGMAELLRESSLDEEQKKYVEIFQRAGESLVTIINDILDLSKIEAGHFELDKYSFSLGEVVEKSLEIMSLKAHQKDLELVVDLEENLHDRYLGDGHRLGQILLNLLGNAIKFTQRGEVLLQIKGGRGHGDKREIIIQVQDTGIGMSDEQVSRLFERFSQADSSITKEYGGTGLGLNITRKLVQLMDGEIYVQSALGIGSKFSIRINLTEDMQTPTPDLRPQLLGKRILIVDDNKTNRYIFRKILENERSIVDEAEDGRKGLDLIEKRFQEKAPYDLVLLDCRMPLMDGFDVAEKLYKEERKQLVMMITSDNRPGDLARARNLGLKSYLMKPVLKGTLIREIQKILHIQSVQTEVSPTSDVTGSTNFLRILLVDDNAENRLIIRSFLKSQKWEIIEAKNGLEALAVLEKTTVDLILMDMQMPVMDGYTTTREIRKREELEGISPVPVIALTAYALKEEIDKSFEAGCVDHLSKPVVKSDLLRTIGHYTDDITVTVDADLTDLVPDYLSRRDEEIRELKELLKNDSFHEIQSLGHKLRGAAGSYGFSELTEFGKGLEEKAQLKDKVAIKHTLLQYELYLSKLKVAYSSGVSE